MYSRGHAVLSGVIGIPLAFGTTGGAAAVLLWGYVMVVGVGIDVDHFVIGRLNRGDWTNVRRCIENPTRIFLEQSELFDSGDIWRDQRLLSHLLIGGVLTTGMIVLSAYWALATAVTVYTHLLADLYSDIQTRDEYLERGV